MRTVVWGFIGIVSCSAIAQEATVALDAARLDTVVVIGEREQLTSRHLAGSVDVIGRTELEYEHVDDTMELLTKVPGVSFTRFNQGIINTDIAIRGFGSDGATPHAKLLIDGIPANLHNGYSELDQLFPMHNSEHRGVQGHERSPLRLVQHCRKLRCRNARRHGCAGDRGNARKL